MAHSISNRVLTTPDNLPVTARPSTAKAQLRSQALTGDLSEVVNEAIRKAHGKQEVAAASIGKDPGNFNRDLKRALEILAQLGPDCLAQVGKGLDQQFGPLAATPAHRLRQIGKEVRRLMDEADQLADYIKDVA